MFIGSYRFDGDPTTLLAQYEAMLDAIGEDRIDLQLCVVDDEGITVYDTCPSEEAFHAFSRGDDLRGAVASVGLPVPVVRPLGDVRTAVVDGRRLAGIAG